jgi:hypothetical protein
MHLEAHNLLAVVMTYLTFTMQLCFTSGFNVAATLTTCTKEHHHHSTVTVFL